MKHESALKKKKTLSSYIYYQYILSNFIINYEFLLEIYLGRNFLPTNHFKLLKDKCIGSQQMSYNNNSLFHKIKSLIFNFIK